MRYTTEVQVKDALGSVAHDGHNTTIFGIVVTWPPR